MINIKLYFIRHIVNNYTHNFFVLLIIQKNRREYTYYTYLSDLTMNI